MAKILENVAEEFGLNYYAKDNALYGDYRGYKVIVQDYKSAGFFIIKVPFISNAGDSINLAGSLALDLKSENKKITECTYENNCITVKLAQAVKKETNKEAIKDILTKITTYGYSNGFVTSCEHCATTDFGKLYEINNFPVYLCDSCYSSFTNEVESLQQEFKEKDSNIFTGVVGALIGALIGVALWVFVYNLGYIAALCGFALAVCTIKGYELLGGKLNKTGMLITIAITLVMVYVATHLSYGFTIYNELKDYGGASLFDSIKSVSEFKAMSTEISNAFIKDLVMGYLFTLFGAISAFSSAYKKSNFKYNTKSLSE